MTAYQITPQHDDFGPPIMLAARAPGQVAAQPDSSGAVVRRGAASGNPNFDPVTGRFAGRKLNQPEVIRQAGEAIQAGALPQRAGIPQGVSAQVWERRLDVVREAARMMDFMDAVSATAFLAEKVQDVSQVDINSFLADVRLQRISDLVDILDTTVKARKDRQPVRVVAPNRWTKQTFNGLTDAEALSLVKRLEGKSWDAADITKYVVNKIRDPQRKAFLQQNFGEPAAPEGKKVKQ